jgi:hypothetical protein
VLKPARRKHIHPLGFCFQDFFSDVSRVPLCHVVSARLALLCGATKKNCNMLLSIKKNITMMDKLKLRQLFTELKTLGIGLCSVIVQCPIPRVLSFVEVELVFHIAQRQ